MHRTAFEITLAKIQSIIAHTTGNELEDIEENSLLEEDLDIVDRDFSRVIQEINKAFEINLSAEAILEEAETVRELALLVHEEAELG